MIRNGRDVFGDAADNAVFIAVFNRSCSEEHSVTLEIGDFAQGEFVDAIANQGENTYHVVRGKLTLKIEPLKGIVLKQNKLVQHYPHEAGVLLHPTSLPSKYGIGDLGKEAYKFIDLLQQVGQKVWQLLPLGPVDYGCSPYQSPSAFAGNEMLVDVEALVEAGLLKTADIRLEYVNRSSFVDFERARNFKNKCFKKAWSVFKKQAAVNKDYQEFCSKESYWLDDYALFQAAKKEYRGASWNEWPENIRSRNPEAIKKLQDKLADSIGLVKFTQYLFAQ